MHKLGDGTTHADIPTTDLPVTSLKFTTLHPELGSIGTTWDDSLSFLTSVEDGTGMRTIASETGSPDVVVIGK